MPPAVTSTQPGANTHFSRAQKCFPITTSFLDLPGVAHLLYLAVSPQTLSSPALPKPSRTPATASCRGESGTGLMGEGLQGLRSHRGTLLPCAASRSNAQVRPMTNNEGFKMRFHFTTSPHAPSCCLAAVPSPANTLKSDMPPQPRFGWAIYQQDHISHKLQLKGLLQVLT